MPYYVKFRLKVNENMVNIQLMLKVFLTFDSMFKYVPSCSCTKARLFFIDDISRLRFQLFDQYISHYPALMADNTCSIPAIMKGFVIVYVKLLPGLDCIYL